MSEIHVALPRDSAWRLRDLAVKEGISDAADAIRDALDRRRRASTGRRTFHCLSTSCGSFVSRPSAVCKVCGNDPVPHNGDRYEFDRAHGWDDL